ncbi:MAG: cohesin domain-containing protein [Candidatus Roizmanbacteria bacterium]|nr:cohesin domain-containing protein [Candidatus Roizmanbacteria bacterium]
MKRTLFSFGIAFVVFLLVHSDTYAATLSLDPATQSIPTGDTFDVLLQIDTEGESTTSTDAVMSFDSSILSVISIEEGDHGSNPFFPDLFQNISPGEMYIGASVIESIDTRSGTGTVATITFKGLSPGVSDVIFDCTPGKTSDTNISKSDKNATDIVVCTALTNGRYTVGSGPVQPANPTPTPVGAVVFTPTPTATMPPSGSAEVTMGITGVAVLLLVLGISGKMLLKV